MGDMFIKLPKKDIQVMIEDGENSIAKQSRWSSFATNIYLTIYSAYRPEKIRWWDREEAGYYEEEGDEVGSIGTTST